MNPIDLSEPTCFGVQIDRHVSLAPLTTIKVGGTAEYFATVRTVDQLIQLIRWAQQLSLPYLILGGGSNILISDQGVRGLVIHNRCRTLRIEPVQTECAQREPHQPMSPMLFVESGAALAGAARRSIQLGLTGLEWAVSVPGTVGGAVVGNAGAYGGEVKDSLTQATLLFPDGSVREYGLHDFDYAYRDSSLKRLRLVRAGFHLVVLSAAFRLKNGSQEEIRKRADQFLQHRRQTQPVEPSLGSTFMNPKDDYAGRLIEQADLIGKCVGGIEVSACHANFLINREGVGSATASDVVALIRSIQEEVAHSFGVRLKPEVQFVGEWERIQLYDE